MIFRTFVRPSAAPLRLLCALVLSSTFLFPLLAEAAETLQGIGITYGQPAVQAAEFSGDLRDCRWRKHRSPRRESIVRCSADRHRPSFRKASRRSRRSRKVRSRRCRVRS